MKARSVLEIGSIVSAVLGFALVSVGARADNLRYRCVIQHGANPDSSVPVTPPSESTSIVELTPGVGTSVRIRGGFFTDSWRQGRHNDHIESEWTSYRRSSDGIEIYRFERTAAANAGPDYGPIFYSTWKHRAEKLTVRLNETNPAASTAEFERMTWTTSSYPEYQAPAETDVTARAFPAICARN